MFTLDLEPSFNDTDALGHITNTKLPVWFETARSDFFRLFIPDLDPKKWNLILAHIDVDFHEQIFFGHPVKIYSWTEKIGTKSFTIKQEAWQNGKRCASGSAVLVRFDYTVNQSVNLSADERAALAKITPADY